MPFTHTAQDESATLPDPHSDSKQDVPIIEMEATDSGSSPGRSDSYLYPPGLAMEEEKHSFALSDVVNEDDKSFEPWPTELEGVDINIAPDGTFLETSSGPAARELKRRYDARYGVSVNVRSPYAITAFVNQHGKQMFRVGHRELSAPAASSAEVAAEVEDRLTQSRATPHEPSSSPQRPKRRSRMSMHTLFPPNPWMGHRPPNPPHPAPISSGLPKKLRKARSIPDMPSATTDVKEESTGGPSAPTHTGRAHSQSVTAMDMPRFMQPSVVSVSSRNLDVFGDVMEWFSPASSAATTYSSSSFLPGTPSLVHSEKSDSRPIIAHPFGVGIIFESPLPVKKNSKVAEQLSEIASRHVRPMQSFESGLTARQDGPLLSGDSEPGTPEVDNHRPQSAIRMAHTRPTATTETASRPSSAYEPPAEAFLLSDYATHVFDTLQTYRGLPNLDKLAEDDKNQEMTTVKISLSTDSSAVPRDDPRFVIWGEAVQDQEFWDGHSNSRDSITSDMSMSKRRGSKASRARSPEPSNRSVTTGSHRMLLAATIERWIAQLTSDLNYDELLDFFLTYRAFISGVDLCHLLISRFQWALQQPKNAQDASVRQVVRVRTFVAIRYWLLTFFTVDFIPNRELRLTMANWLNTLIRDPLLKQHSDGLGIVRRLAKVAKDCKQTHIRSTGGNQSGPRKSVSVNKSEKVKTHVLGQKFAEAVLKDEEDSDVDLDFLPDEASTEPALLATNDPANAHLAAGHVGAVLAPARPATLPLSSFNILQRIDQAAGPSTDVEASTAQLAVTLPMHNSALSRAFVKTIGRLGRLKRVLHSRSSNRTTIAPCAGVSAFDLELASSRDLLAAKGGVEQYLKGMEPSLSRQPPAPLVAPISPESPPRPTASSPRAASNLQSTSSTSLGAQSSTSIPPSPPPPAKFTPHEPMTPTTPTAKRHIPSERPISIPQSSDELDPPSSSDIEDGTTFLPTPPPEEPEHLSFERLNPIHQSLAPSQRPESIRSFASSTGSLGEILDGEGSVKPMFSRHPVEHFDIVSLDDFDMSDTSSEIHDAGPSLPPGLKKQARKLPMRKDFEFLPRRSEISSMGIVSRSSVASGPSSNTSSASVGGLGGNIQQWQMNALLDSLSINEEDGDVDAALKRLEGQINPQKMQEKRSKVDGWVKQIQARLAAGDYQDEEPRFPIDSDEEDMGDDQGPDEDDNHESVSQHNVVLYPPGLEDVSGQAAENPHTPIPSQQALNIPSVSSSSSSDVGSSTRSEDARPVVEEAVPVEILRSRVSTILPPVPGPDFPVSIPTSRFAAQDALKVHQSFILSYRAVTLAEQFSMIDRELFMGVKFEELVTEEWVATEEVNVYDWAQYLKDRATWRAEGRNLEKTTALAALRARFNLTANFVISEIVLTQPAQRAMVVAKFIRIAWKSYQLSNFNTLVAIIAALQGDKVAQVMGKSGWNKVGSFEMRVYRDLKTFVTGASDFALIRSAVEAIVDAKPTDNASHTNSIAGSSESKGKASADARLATPTACIPFIGIYLAQLQRLKRLPDLIDPTSPNTTVLYNATTNDFDPPVNPEAFSALEPLPHGMRLEPLVNVHKQRKIAAVIKSLVAGQHIASRVHFELDKKLFQRCTRLRALEPEMLQRAIAVYAD